MALPPDWMTSMAAWLAAMPWFQVDITMGKVPFFSKTVALNSVFTSQEASTVAAVTTAVFFKKSLLFIG